MIEQSWTPSFLCHKRLEDQDEINSVSSNDEEDCFVSSTDDTCFETDYSDYSYCSNSEKDHISSSESTHDWNQKHECKIESLESRLQSKDDESRFCLYPIQHLDLWKFYKKHQQTFWTAEEIDFMIDKKDWNVKLNNDERWFIEHILAFFAGSDGIVLENLVTHFCQEITLPEVRSFYSFQAMMENVHSEVYSLMIDTFIECPLRKQTLFEAIDKIPCVRKKAMWAVKWISKHTDLAHRLVAFSIVEGLFFSGSFCAIFWLKERGLLVHSLGKSNEWIARDEGLHTEFAVYLYREYIQHKIPISEIHCMMKEAVDLEIEFLCDALPVRLIGMNSDLMKQYILFVADRLLQQLGVSTIWNVKNPFVFMEKIGLDGKTNFFEQRVSEYNKSMDCLPMDLDFSSIQDDDF